VIISVVLLMLKRCLFIGCICFFVVPVGCLGLVCKFWSFDV